MGPTSLSRFSDLRGIVMAALAIAVLVLGGAGALMLFAASGLDRLQAEREAALVERRLTRMQGQLIDDVTSATIWNDAVERVAAGDIAWTQTNFHDYYADYMDHDLTLLYDGSGMLISASRGGEPVAPAAVAPFLRAATPMVSEVARLAHEPARRAAFGFDAVATRSAVVEVDGALHLVAVTSIVPEDDTVARPARDAILVSTRPFSAFLTSLTDELAIVDPAHVQTQVAAPGVLPLAAASAGAPGAVAWSPLRPGGSLLNQALPALGAVFLLVLGAGLALFLRVDRIVRRLIASEEALVEARDRAEAANQAKSRFLGQMSHELRTPLNGVMGMAEVLSMGPLTPIQQGHLAILKGSGADLLRMIENILLVTRLDRQQATPAAIEPFSPRVVVDQVVGLYRDRAEARGLELKLANTLRGRRLGSADDLGRLLGHLLDNALAYTPDGSVGVSAQDDGDALILSVSDTGIGIDHEVVPRLFERFVQADDTLSRAYDGAGLGLSICQGLVHAMGGEITVDSVVGQGSTFTVTLPLPHAGDECDRLELAA